MSETAPKIVTQEAPVSLEEARTRLRLTQDTTPAVEQNPISERRQLAQTLGVVHNVLRSLPSDTTREERFAKTREALEKAGISTSDKPGKFWADIRDMRARSKELDAERAARRVVVEQPVAEQDEPEAPVASVDAVRSKMRAHHEATGNAAIDDLVNFDENLVAHHEKGTSGRRAGAFMSNADLANIKQWQDEIRDGLDERQLENEKMEQAKAFRPALDGIERALAENADKIDDDASSITEIGLIRKELIKSGVATSLEVGNMTDEYIQDMLAYARPAVANTAPVVSNPDAPARDAIIDAPVVSNPDAPARDAIVDAPVVSSPDAPARDAIVDAPVVSNPDAPARDAIVDAPDNSLELLALRYELEAARNAYAKLEAKRQSRVGDYKGVRAIHGFNAAREAYLAKRIEYGKLFTQSAVESAQNATEKTAATVEYFIEQENVLREKINEYTSETRAQKFVHWMNKGTKKQRFLRYALIGAGSAAAGAAIGAAGIGLGIAGGLAVGTRYVRGWGSKAGRQMDEVSVNRQSVDQRVRLRSQESDDVTVASDIFSNYFDSDAKKEQKKNRKAIGTGIGFVAAGAALGYGIQNAVEYFSGSGASTVEAASGDVNAHPHPDRLVDGGGADVGADAAAPAHEFVDTQAVYSVHNGEGFYETFKDMGIPKEQWADVLKDAGPQLEKQGWSYFDSSANEWRIAKTGQFPEGVIDTLKQTSAAHGFTFR